MLFMHCLYNFLLVEYCSNKQSLLVSLHLFNLYNLLHLLIPNRQVSVNRHFMVIKDLYLVLLLGKGLHNYFLGPLIGK